MFPAVYSRTQGELERLVNEFARGSITPEEFGDRAYAALSDGHTDAYVAGMRRAGSRLDPLTLQNEAQRLGRAAADKENEFLDMFVRDLEDGRYLDASGALRADFVLQRADMYALKTRATANEGFVSASASNVPDEEFTWLMTAREHCGDCPRLAALSPYKADELFTMPGGGDTECLSRCQCVLVRHSDGLHSFPRP